MPILALSATEGSVKQLTLDRGVLPLQVQSFQGTDSVLKSALKGRCTLIASFQNMLGVLHQ